MPCPRWRGILLPERNTRCNRRSVGKRCRKALHNMRRFATQGEQHGIFRPHQPGAATFSRQVQGGDERPARPRSRPWTRMFWDGLEETLILADMGGSGSVARSSRTFATKPRARRLPDAYAVLDTPRMTSLPSTLPPPRPNPSGGDPRACCSSASTARARPPRWASSPRKAHDAGRKVILGSADTFRAAAIEQLEEWARRAERCHRSTRERGSRPGKRVLRHHRSAPRRDGCRPGAHRHGRTPAYV